MSEIDLGKPESRGLFLDHPILCLVFLPILLPLCLVLLVLSAILGAYTRVAAGEVDPNGVFGRLILIAMGW